MFSTEYWKDNDIVHNLSVMSMHGIFDSEMISSP